MRHSKLELYIDIAKSLMNYGPLNLDNLAPCLKIDSASLKEHMIFLVAQGMIQEKDSNSIMTYNVTERGIKVLKFFKIQTPKKVTIEKPNSVKLKTSGYYQNDKREKDTSEHTNEHSNNSFSNFMPQS